VRFANPALFILAVLTALVVILYASVRTDGWLPAFRQMRIRRALVLTLLTWGMFALFSMTTNLATP
jgi:hypothetical protein